LVIASDGNIFPSSGPDVQAEDVISKTEIRTVKNRDFFMVFFLSWSRIILETRMI
jgi:hypothetical protein